MLSRLAVLQVALSVAVVFVLGVVLSAVVAKLNTILKTGRGVLLQFPTDVAMTVPSLQHMAKALTKGA